MNEEQTKAFALSLLYADSEDAVIEILSDHGYWDNHDAWRLYGDKEGNFSQIGGQQNTPEAALVEKLINSVDSRLLLECHKAGIDPESESAPQNVRDAVATFFEGKRSFGDEAGNLGAWPTKMRTEESSFITLAATGGRPRQGQKTRNMCLTIADQGEGQSALRLPKTIVSLNAKNKQRIPFVQGKFNMGGSGALRFCGTKGLQLIISKRHPELASREIDSDPSSQKWSVTIVRREQPTSKSGDPIHSEFTYLAPLNIDKHPRRGNILSFFSEELTLMPHADKPYTRPISWGTAIKLYEFETNSGQSNILMKGGILFALERLLPQIGLPIRLHECRGYEGKEGSFDTTLAGLTVRLEEGKGSNLEEGFPISCSLKSSGMEMTAKIYAFKDERASTYLRDEGVIFAINGQSHGNLPKSIFSRPKAVGLPRLKDSLLMIVDCSQLKAIQREDLFMTSRDRLNKNAIRYEVERDIEDLLRSTQALKDLQQQRRANDVDTALNDERPLEEVLKKVFRSSPTLKSLFLSGSRLNKPFASRGSGINGDARGSGSGDQPFQGLRHPTKFEIFNWPYGKIYKRSCEIDRRARIKLVTDVENEYFDRPRDKGVLSVELLESTRPISGLNYTHSLSNGDFSLNLSLPSEVLTGDQLTIRISVNDPTLLEPFINEIQLTVAPKSIKPNGTRKTGEKKSGGGKSGNETSGGLSLPRVIPVHEDDSHWQRYNFNSSTSCHVIRDEIGGDAESSETESVFYINLDNDSLRTEMKFTKGDPRLLQKKFEYANVLIGLAIIHDYERSTKSNENSADDETEPEVDKIIRQVTEALAPILLPMIDQLSGLTDADLDAIGDIGDED